MQGTHGSLDARGACGIVKTVKRKRAVPDAAATSDAVVPEVILERARRTIESERFKKPQACVICGGECAPNSNEGLCWVCRRLKLSAWKDADVQMPAQE
jgi:hypothetical protein